MDCVSCVHKASPQCMHDLTQSQNVLDIAASTKYTMPVSCGIWVTVKSVLCPDRDITSGQWCVASDNN